MTCSTRIPLRRVLLLCLIAGSIQLCRAQAPLGEIDFSFDSGVLPLWDLSGTFQPTNGTLRAVGGQQVPFISAVDLTHDGHGRLKGAGTTALGIGNDFVAADYKASGRVSGSSASPRVTLVTRFRGNGTVSGANTTFSISVNYHLTVNAADGTLTGTARGEAKFSNFGGTRIVGNVDVPIASGTNASWILQLNTTPLGRVAGTGNILMADSRVLSGNVKGSFSARSNLTKMKFSGINDAKGSTLNVSVASSGDTNQPNQLVSLRGKVLGQTLRQ